MNLNATYTAIRPGLTTSFYASGGSAPYIYEITSGNVGGTINATTGVYTAPSAQNFGSDIITATDSLGVEVELPIMVCSPIMLVCDIIKKEMGLDSKQIYIYKQKINVPIDDDIYIAVGNISNKPFGNNIYYDAAGNAVQSTNFQSTLSIDMLSRSITALNRKEEVIMALYSHYSIQQQEKNSFSLARIPTGFIDLSEIEGSAIPYRFHLTLNMQYFVTKTTVADYYTDFPDVEFTIEP